MIKEILSSMTSSVTEFKRNPLRALEEGQGADIAVLNRNRPVFYCLSPQRYEQMLKATEDLEDAQLVQQRESASDRELVKVDPNDL